MGRQAVRLAVAGVALAVTGLACSRAGRQAATPAGSDRGPRVLVLEPDAKGKLRCGIPLYDHFEVLHDPDGTLTIEDVSSAEGARRFRPNRTRESPIAVGAGAVWVRLRLHNEVETDHIWWVAPGRWNLGELYTPTEGGFTRFRSGGSLPPPEPMARETRGRFYLLKLAVPGGRRDMTVFLRLAGRPASYRTMPVAASLHNEMHLPALFCAERGLELYPGPSGKLPRSGTYEASYILTDPRGKLTIADVTSLPYAEQFVPNQTFSSSFDGTVGAIWVRMLVRSNLPEDHTWYLYMRYWEVAELYVPDGNGFKVSRSGAFVPPDERSAPEAHLRMYLLKLPIPRGLQEMTVHVRLQGDLYLGPDRGVVGLLNPELTPGLTRQGRDLLFLQATTLGVLVALGLYHLVLHARVRERCYLLFALAVLGRGLLIAADNRLLLEFVWPHAARWDFTFRLFQGPLWVVPFFMFLAEFLETRVHTPRLHVVLKLLLIPAFLEPLLVWLRPPWCGVVLNIQYILWAVVPILVALAALRRHSREAAIFLAANLVMLGYSLTYTINQTGVQVVLPLWGYFAGEIASAVLFSVAVAELLRRLRREKEQVEREVADAALLLKRRELEKVLLAGELGEARLRALRNQLQPHFLFNTLNSISALMHSNPGEAERNVTLLADLLRTALVERNSSEVPLHDEVTFVSRYLEIEKTRFPTRLSVIWEIAPDTLAASVPHLVLQPLVENAVRHGIAPRSKPGRVWVRSWAEGERLHLEVRDDGAGVREGGEVREGVGLSNTRARLRHLYGAAATLVAGGVSEGGFAARVSMPFRLATATDREPLAAEEGRSGP